MARRRTTRTGAKGPENTPEQSVLTVSQLTARIKQSMETAFGDVCVVGEISRCTHAASGHVYLTLKDEDAVLNAAIWRHVASRVKFDLEEGLEVVARGSIDVYPPRGSYQLIISDLQPRGLGALQLAFKQLVERLEKEKHDIIDEVRRLTGVGGKLEPGGGKRPRRESPCFRNERHRAGNQEVPD